MLREIIGIVLAATYATAAISTVNLTENSERQAREYYSYYPEDDKKYSGYAEYPPSNHLSYKEETPPNCPPNSLAPLLSNGLNFLLLKLGAVGIVKSIIAVIFFVMLLKLPILLAKAAFVKAIIFPALIAPIMMLFSNMGNNMMAAMMADKPAKPAADGMMMAAAAAAAPASGRSLDDVVAQSAWQSVKFLLDSERCAERMACQFGVFNNDTNSGAALSRMAKYIEESSPSSTRSRIRSLREAFAEGNTQGVCLDQVYRCQRPHLILSQGANSYRVL